MSVKTYKFYMFEVWLNIISMECVSMGFFNYSKPGPGIDKNAPKKKGVALCFPFLFCQNFAKNRQIARSNSFSILRTVSSGSFSTSTGVISARPYRSERNCMPL